VAEHGSNFSLAVNSPTSNNGETSAKDDDVVIELPVGKSLSLLTSHLDAKSYIGTSEKSV